MSLLPRPRASDAAPQPSAADPGAKYRSIVENAVAGMFQTSPDGRYLTANPALARRIGGTGLGLALVKEIATAHGGRVWVESTLGAGSTFHLVLPRADAPGDQVAARS